MNPTPHPAQSSRSIEMASCSISSSNALEIQGRYRGDTGEIQGRYRGDTGEIQGRYKGDIGELWRRYGGDSCSISSSNALIQGRCRGDIWEI